MYLSREEKAHNIKAFFFYPFFFFICLLEENIAQYKLHSKILCLIITKQTINMGYAKNDSKAANASSVEIPFDMPVIDYKGMHGNPEERAKWLKELDRGFQTYGFCYLSNSTISEELLEEAFEWVS